jgi:hypothetical protein
MDRKLSHFALRKRLTSVLMFCFSNVRPCCAHDAKLHVLTDGVLLCDVMRFGQYQCFSPLLPSSPLILSDALYTQTTMTTMTRMLALFVVAVLLMLAGATDARRVRVPMSQPTTTTTTTTTTTMTMRKSERRTMSSYLSTNEGVSKMESKPAGGAPWADGGVTVISGGDVYTPGK